jgi:hypothetical protein
MIQVSGALYHPAPYSILVWSIFTTNHRTISGVQNKYKGAQYFDITDSLQTTPFFQSTITQETIMATIATGQYTIVNVRQSNLAYLPDPNDGTPVAANYEQNNTKERVSLPLTYYYPVAYD